MRRVKLSYSLQQKHFLQTSQNQKLILSAFAIGMLLGSLFLLKSNISDYTNEGIVAVEANQTMAFGTNFTNTDQGLWQNEGEIFFQKNLVNDGTLDCNNCTSGLNVFNNNMLQPQSISGLQPVEMYDVMLNNAGNIWLDTELQIVNSLQLSAGKIIVNPGIPEAFVHFKNDAVYSGSSDNNHIQGYVGKTGDDAFIFPIGDGNYLNPIEISGSTPSDFFKAAYFSVDLGTTTFSDGAVFQTNNKEGIIQTVHSEGFWDIDGSSSAVVKLEWDLSNDLNSLLPDVDDLIVAGWNGVQWVSLGQNDLMGSLSAGSIKTDPMVPDNYLAYTFARVYAGTFPVEWLTFSVQGKPQGAFLEWVTAQEIGTDKYVIERSENLTSEFIGIGERKAAGDSQEISTYSFTDEEILQRSATKYFYRLKQIDLDGKFSFSKVVEFSLRNKPPQLRFTFFPNPARDHITVALNEAHAESVQLSIINPEGKILLNLDIAPEEQTKISLAHLPSGNYVVRVSDEIYGQTRKLIIR